MGRKILIFVLPSLVFCGCAAFFLQGTFAREGFPLDDAWIHRVYSRSFAFGKGFQYNEGVQENGETSPLWAIFSSPAHWLEPLLGTEGMVYGVKALGIMLGVAILVLFQYSQFSLGVPLWTSLLAATLFALDSRFIFAAISGMEPILWVALWIGAFACMIQEKFILGSILLGLTPTTRPESVILLPFFLFVFLLPGRKHTRSETAIYCFFLCFPVILWTFFSWTVTGRLLPNSFYVKSVTDLPKKQTFLTAGKALTEHGIPSTPAFYWGLAGLALFLWRKRNFQAFLLFSMFFFLPMVFIFSILCTRNFFIPGYYWSRWIDPASLAICLAACLGISTLLFGGRVAAADEPLKRWEWASVFATFFFLIISATQLEKTISNRAFHLNSDSRVITLMNVQAGKWINLNTVHQAKIGVNDAGAVRYFGERFTVDLCGLNRHELAFQKKSVQQAISEMDWLAIFPSWFHEDSILPQFEPKEIFSVSHEEYSICPDKRQNTLVIFNKKQTFSR